MHILCVHTKFQWPTQSGNTHIHTVWKLVADIHPSLSWQRHLFVAVVVGFCFCQRWGTIKHHWHFNFVLNGRILLQTQKNRKIKRLLIQIESVEDEENAKANRPRINVEKVEHSVLWDYLRVAKDVVSLCSVSLLRWKCNFCSFLVLL